MRHGDDLGVYGSQLSLVYHGLMIDVGSSSLMAQVNQKSPVRAQVIFRHLTDSLGTPTRLDTASILLRQMSGHDKALPKGLCG